MMWRLMMVDATEKSAVEMLEGNQAEVVFDSPPSEVDDDLWLAHGAKMLDDSVPSVHNAANQLIQALGLLQSVYLGILGFAKFIPDEMEIYNKALFFAPLIPWVIATYYSLRVMKTEIIKINLRSPSDIREKAAGSLEKKQRRLEIAFALLIAGLVAAFIMVIFRLHI
jgi:hypothetical protein